MVYEEEGMTDTLEDIERRHQRIVADLVAEIEAAPVLASMAFRAIDGTVNRCPVPRSVSHCLAVETFGCNVDDVARQLGVNPDAMVPSGGTVGDYGRER